MKKTVFYHCITPLHMGSGTELGIVDLPIQRERHTGFPKMEASGIKGAFRALSEKLSEGKGEIDKIYGPETKENEQEASMGELQFGDGRILLLPVRSAKGIFAWVTCPYVLDRFIRECVEEQNRAEWETLLTEAFKLIDTKAILLDSNSDIAVEQSVVILEDFKFEVGTEVGTLNIENIPERLKKHILIITDEVFSYFCEMATEIITRIRIGDDGVVEDGALFTEEFVPEETVFYTVMQAKKEIFEDWKETISYQDENNNIIQLGGNTTLGKGFTEYWIVDREVERN